MALKDIELTMAEKLPASIRDEFGLPASGIVIVETTNPDLKAVFKPMPEGGLREYLLSLGAFKDVPMDE